MFKNTLKRVSHSTSPFVKDLAVFTSGSSLAYILGIVLTPLIARLYNDEAYGVFALFNSIIANLMVFSTLNYSEALLIPKTERKFLRLVQLCVLIAFSFSILILVVVFIFEENILSMMNAQQVKGLMYLVPLVIFVNAILLVWDSWNLRLKEFKRGAVVKTVTTGIAKSTSIVLALVIPGNSVGLILGEYGSRLFSVFLLTSQSIYQKLGRLITDISLIEIKNIAFEYKNYPIYNLQSSWVVIIANHLPIYLISLFFSIGETGQYSMAMSLLNAPIIFIGLSIAKVYMQRAVQIYHEEGIPKLKTDVLKLYKNVTVLSFLPFLVLATFGDIVFSLLLGSGWNQAGQTVRMLAFPFMFQFIVLCIKSIFRVIQKEKLQFKIDIITTIAMAVFLTIVVIYFSEFSHMIICFGVIAAITQLLTLYYIFKSINVENPISYIVFPSIIVAILFTLSSWLRLLF